MRLICHVDQRRPVGPGSHAPVACCARSRQRPVASEAAGLKSRGVYPPRPRPRRGTLRAGLAVLCGKRSVKSPRPDYTTPR